MFILELRVLPVLRRSPEGSGVPMDFADVGGEVMYIPAITRDGTFGKIVESASIFGRVNTTNG